MALLAFAPPVGLEELDSSAPVLIPLSASASTSSSLSAKYDYTWSYTYHSVRNPPLEFLQMRS